MGAEAILLRSQSRLGRCRSSSKMTARPSAASRRSPNISRRRATDGVAASRAKPAERAEMRRLVAWFDVNSCRSLRAASGRKGRAPLHAPRSGRRFARHDAGPRGIGASSAITSHMSASSRTSEMARRATAVASPTSRRRRIFPASISWARCRGEARPPAKSWYQRLKSRPSFRPLLADNVRGIPPPPATPTSISELYSAAMEDLEDRLKAKGGAARLRGLRIAAADDDPVLAERLMTFIALGRARRHGLAGHTAARRADPRHVAASALHRSCSA